MDKEMKNKARNARCGAKGALTRAMNVTNELIEASRSKSEVKQAFEELQWAHEGLVMKHEEFTMLLDDEVFEEAEKWMQKIDEEKSKQNVSDSVIGESSEETNEESNGSQGSNNLIEQSTVFNENNHPSTMQNPEMIQYSQSSAKPFTVKHEKAKLPVFAGDVRQYFIFKSDYKHAVEAELYQTRLP
ncbi:Hypothetical predicted protein [Paramuricea clavata]|uniref:Uncharacterized protein n=1 Tax=Paramuricea clavata TaxID=317549 RepID=A0A6S7GAV6_PARCT|nr:Hypothetical predicted protein [Paramuricea clavata]